MLRTAALLRLVSTAGACLPAGKGEGGAVVSAIVSFLAVLLVVRKILPSRSQDFARCTFAYLSGLWNISFYT